jgi:hypothetical protein
MATPTTWRIRGDVSAIPVHTLAFAAGSISQPPFEPGCTMISRSNCASSAGVEP